MTAHCVDCTMVVCDRAGCGELVCESEAHDCGGYDLCDECYRDEHGCAECGAVAEQRYPWGETWAGTPWLICDRCVARHMVHVKLVRLAAHYSRVRAESECAA